MSNYIDMDKILGNNERVEILGTPIDVLSMAETVNLVENYVKEKVPLHLMGVNADKLLQLSKNPRLKSIVNSCGIINADGASVVLASKFLNKPLSERVAGVDLMINLVKLSEQEGYKIYLLGAEQEVIEKTQENLKKDYPRLNIVGFRNGYFTENEWADIAEEFKILRPDFVFVGITSPLKEYLVDFFLNSGVNTVFMGVGGTFDVISGKTRRAPNWMQNGNLEWLYRMIQEPRRLFVRYFKGNFLFIVKILGEKLKKSG